MLYDRAVGVMAVHSPQERAFDEGHVELMRVLASEAGIAIENARLFSEEQTKSRHLTLLNNVSRHAITTLNPDEMLSKIAAEIETGLTYDHIGIGILDYAAKECRHPGRSRTPSCRPPQQIPFGEGLVGQRRAHGRNEAVRDFAAEVSAGAPSSKIPSPASRFPFSYARSIARRALRRIPRAVRLRRRRAAVARARSPT